MLVILVNVHVKQEFTQTFIDATQENARNSVQEPGIARFDFYQQMEDPTRFSLVEIYRSEDGPAQHRETAHYKIWKESVELMMVEPRTRTLYRNVYPAEIK